ncbi:hypothetical protein JTE90_029403 [Oedothorax gibbosus]|uniref:Uncharacterized protein n=1 Tax=Oedothorax gibbosus TaxID=931172 RepID=A0AAV6UA90_9ARAC|nr:hypothetical protein JTE90_029403 [Oedothorax gibbosus]
MIIHLLKHSLSHKSRISKSSIKNPSKKKSSILLQNTQNPKSELCPCKSCFLTIQLCAWQKSFAGGDAWRRTLGDRSQRSSRCVYGRRFWRVLLSGLEESTESAGGMRGIDSPFHRIGTLFEFEFTFDRTIGDQKKSSEDLEEDWCSIWRVNYQLSSSLGGCWKDLFLGL